MKGSDRKLLTCLKCGWKWHPRKEGRSTWCPNIHCHSPTWDKS